MGLWDFFLRNLEVNLIRRDMMPRFSCFSSCLTLTTYRYECLKATKFARLAYALIFVQKNYTPYIKEQRDPLEPS
jgi:hypothetical protein